VLVPRRAPAPPIQLSSRDPLLLVAAQRGGRLWQGADVQPPYDIAGVHGELTCYDDAESPRSCRLVLGGSPIHAGEGAHLRHDLVPPDGSDELTRVMRERLAP